MIELGIDMWKSIESNPFKAHKEIIKGGGRRPLMNFVKQMAIQYKIAMDMLPETKNMTQRWKDIARCILKEILPHNPSVSKASLPSEPYISKGIKQSHIRQACERRINGKIVYIKASLINAFMLDPIMRNAMEDMVGSYNKYVVDVAKKNRTPVSDFPAIANWVKPYGRMAGEISEEAELVKTI